MSWLCLLLLILASAMPVLAHGEEDHDDDDAAEVSLVAVEGEFSYHEHVRPIIEASCVACHSEGQIAAFAPLTDTQLVLDAAEDIAWHVRYGYMPPWPPSRLSLPMQADRSLSDDEIATIVAWAESGAALGDSNDYAPAATDGFELVEIRPDLSLQMAEPYTPDESLLDDYRCFAIPLDIDEPRFVTGYQFIPDAAEMAHHSIFYLLGAGAQSAVEQRNYADGAPGWTCYGGAGVSGVVDSFGGWVPGMQPVRFPAGAGFVIKPGQTLVLQMHYNLSASQEPDRSRVLLELAPAGSELAELVYAPLIAPVEIPCPTGVEGPQCQREAALQRVGELYGREASYTPDYLLRSCRQRLDDYADNSGEVARGVCDFPIDEPVTLYSVTGHMHELGRSFQLELNPDTDGALMLLDIPRWDFHWQGEYFFVEPLELARGDVLRMECIWDNSLSDEPRYVVWGEGTSDEMCFGSALALKP